MPNPYDKYDTAGRQCSSTDEGRHVTLRADQFNSPHTWPEYGDPVTFGTTADGYGVGVAFTTGTANADWIAVDTEGIWAVTVHSKDDESAVVDVNIGDVIYINRTTCELSKISSDTTHIVFGYALDTVAAEATSGVICVKVHWDPHRTDEYRDYIAGQAAEDAMLIEVDDASTLGQGEGYAQCLQTTINATGDKTGNAEVHNIAADMAISGDTPYAYGYTGYISTNGNPTIGHMAAMSLVMEDPGSACAALTVLDLETQGLTNSPTGRHTFCRMVAHHAASMPESLIHVEGNGADYAFDFMHSSAPFENEVTGVDATQRIAVRVGADVRYIKLYIDT